MKIPGNLVATFSIVGYDPKAEEWGIAVQSKFIACAAVVSWARAGAGAVATQSYANTSYGPRGLELMAAGMSAQQALELLLADDPEREKRQVGLVDAKGNAATFTGSECFDWAGGICGDNFAAQGNILVGRETVDAMAETFTATPGPLAERLLAALDAGQAAGGDSRGKQAAGLLVVRDKGGYGGFNDRAVDLRVDEHPDPIKELIRIYKLHKIYFGKPAPGDIIDIDAKLRQQIVSHLRTLGYLGEQIENDFDKALTNFLQNENFEERQQPPGKIDKAVYEFLASRARQ